MHGLLIEAVEWVVIYPVHVEPVGAIRRCRDGLHAKVGGERLGVFPSGDEAAEAVWEGFLVQSRVRHAEAAVMHGSSSRHRPRFGAGAAGPRGDAAAVSE